MVDTELLEKIAYRMMDRTVKIVSVSGERRGNRELIKYFMYIY